MGGWQRIGLDDVFPIRQVLPVGPAHAGFCCWARWARFFAVKKMYIMSHSLFTYNITVYIRAGSQEWVDGVGSVWMTFPNRKMLVYLIFRVLISCLFRSRI